MTIETLFFDETVRLVRFSTQKRVVAAATAAGAAAATTTTAFTAAAGVEKTVAAYKGKEGT